MSETPKGQRLGRGLAALLGEAESAEAASEGLKNGVFVPIEKISRNPSQPRERFGEAALEELGRSIAEKGVLQPIIVRPLAGGDGYQIVAGERRWRAAQRAGLHEIPAIVRDLSDSEAMEIALVENIQRRDLDPIEQARGFAVLAEQFSHTQQDIAKIVGKSRAAVANALRLLSLPEDVQALIHEGTLSAGHGRALVNAPDPAGLAARIVKESLSVRQTEQLAARAAPERKSFKGEEQEQKDTDILTLEQDLTRHLGLGVSIASRANGAGTITIRFKTLEQLDDVCRRLSGE